MPKVKRSKKPPPEGWELIEPTLEELEQKMREGIFLFFIIRYFFRKSSKPIETSHLFFLLANSISALFYLVDKSFLIVCNIVSECLCPTLFLTCIYFLLYTFSGNRPSRR